MPERQSPYYPPVQSEECGVLHPPRLRAPWSTTPLPCEREKGHEDTHCVYGSAGFPLFQWADRDMDDPAPSDGSSRG